MSPLQVPPTTISSTGLLEEEEEGWASPLLGLTQHAYSLGQYGDLNSGLRASVSMSYHQPANATVYGKGVFENKWKLFG